MVICSGNRWLSLLLLASLGLGCQRTITDPAPATRYRIAKAAQTALNFKLTMTYQYDNLGRLTQVNEYPVVDTIANVTPSAQTTITYDLATLTYIAYVDKRLTKPYTDASGTIVGTRRTFTYSNRGLPFVVTEYKAVGDFKNLQLTQTFTYEYGPDELPVRLTVMGVGTLMERDVYVYTFVDGNASHSQTTVTTSRSATPTVTEANARFDEAPNIYYHYFAIFPGITSFNKNNVVNNNTLEHDDRGLLVKRIKTGSYVDDVTTYMYEPY